MNKLCTKNHILIRSHGLIWESQQTNKNDEAKKSNKTKVSKAQYFLRTRFLFSGRDHTRNALAHTNHSARKNQPKCLVTWEVLAFFEKSSEKSCKQKSVNAWQLETWLRDGDGVGSERSRKTDSLIIPSANVLSTLHRFRLFLQIMNNLHRHKFV